MVNIETQYKYSSLQLELPPKKMKMIWPYRGKKAE